MTKIATFLSSVISIFRPQTVQATTVESTTMNISEDRIQEIKSILRTVGLPENDYDIAGAIKRKSSYNGGSLEWTERHEGIRFWISGWAHTGQVTGVQVVKHGYTRFTEEEIQEANQKLAAVFA